MQEVCEYTQTRLKRKLWEILHNDIRDYKYICINFIDYTE